MKEKITWSLMAKYLSGETTKEEESQMTEWLQKEDRQRWFRNIQKIYSSNNLNENANFSTERGMQLLNEKLEKKKAKIIRFKSIPVLMRAAAVILILIIAGIMLFEPAIVGTQPDIVTISKQNPEGQKSTIMLPDGSKVTLNAGSTLEYESNFGVDNRTITLTGEAFFDVSKNPDLPFQIHSGDIKIKVIGTVFNVQAFDDKRFYTVTVSEGKVQVSIAEKENPGQVTLRAKEKVKIDKQTKGIIKSKADLATELAWVNNILEFQNTPIRDLKRTLERWYGVSISLENEAINQCLVTGRFENASLERVLGAISYANGFSYELNGKTARLTGKGCKN